jgi:hypothetical protein
MMELPAALTAVSASTGALDLSKALNGSRATYAVPLAPMNE